MPRLFFLVYGHPGLQQHLLKRLLPPLICVCSFVKDLLTVTESKFHLNKINSAEGKNHMPTKQKLLFPKNINRACTLFFQVLNILCKSHSSVIFICFGDVRSQFEVQASLQLRYGGSSMCPVQLRLTDSLAVACRHVACGILVPWQVGSQFPYQGLKPHPLHWKVNS